MAEEDATEVSRIVVCGRSIAVLCPTCSSGALGIRRAPRHKPVGHTEHFSLRQHRKPKFLIEADILEFIGLQVREHVFLVHSLTEGINVIFADKSSVTA